MEYEYERLISLELSRYDTFHFCYDGRRFHESLIEVLNILGRERWQLVGKHENSYIMMRSKVVENEAPRYRIDEHGNLYRI